MFQYLANRSPGGMLVALVQEKSKLNFVLKPNDLFQKSIGLLLVFIYMCKLVIKTA